MRPAPWLGALVGALLAPRAEGLYTVQMYQHPADAVAGLPFGSQPTVALYDDLGMLASTYSGSCYAEVYTSPSGQELVYRNGSSAVRGLRVPFVDGFCVFDGLYINTVGDYTLKLIAEDSDRDPFAYVARRPASRARRRRAETRAVSFFRCRRR